MQTTIYIVLAFSMGLIMSIYLPMNSSVAKYIGSSITANVTFFTVALLTSVLIFLLSGQFNTINHLKDVPAYPVFSWFRERFCGFRHNFSHPTYRRAEIFHFTDKRSNINGDCRQPFWTFGIPPRSYQLEKDDRGNTCFSGRDFLHLLNNT